MMLLGQHPNTGYRASSSQRNENSHLSPRKEHTDRIHRRPALYFVSSGRFRAQSLSIPYPTRFPSLVISRLDCKIKDVNYNLKNEETVLRY